MKRNLLMIALPIVFCFSCNNTPKNKFSPALQTGSMHQLTSSCGLANSSCSNGSCGISMNHSNSSCSSGGCRPILSDEGFVVNGPEGTAYESRYHAPLNVYFDPEQINNPSEFNKSLIENGKIGLIESAEDVQKYLAYSIYTHGKVNVTMFNGYIPMGGCAGYHSGETRMIPSQYLATNDGEVVLLDKEKVMNFEPEGGGVSIVHLALMRLDLGEVEYKKMFEELYNERNSFSPKEFILSRPEYKESYLNAVNIVI